MPVQKGSYYTRLYLSLGVAMILTCHARATIDSSRTCRKPLLALSRRPRARSQVFLILGINPDPVPLPLPH